ncbi:Glutathione transport system permease protein GsiC [Falsiruegeria litorea R37]|uniref:Glutathione transport system permease protein GsiC n=1 Tax=Falsiruegeria litorea R37 TaxID=1200284 RepID=A0A1Y5RV73_9RHOB|nr:ABC transporter permease [Falsiruegeria litorea]SLN26155.1 Glutathione transport system permease protein GsiC [Falsiruegeria litorea R37]
MHALMKMILQRLGIGLLTLFVVSLLIFGAVEMLPGDLAQELLGQGATEETLAELREQLGLNQPAYQRYVNWLGGAIQGDFGTSLANGRDIGELIGNRFVNTIKLAIYAAVIAVPIAITLGLLAALYRNTIFDRVVNIFTLASISFPEFFVAYILILIFSSKLGLFPALAAIEDGAPFTEFLYRGFLPALTLTLVVTAHMMRMTRASIINLLAQPYIEMAGLKGMKRLRVIVKHALPNALAPIINVVALNLAYLITGVVLIEVVFVYPGLGQLLVDSVAKRDVTVVQAACLIFATVYILLNLTADVLSIATNPRLMHRK